MDTLDSRPHLSLFAAAPASPAIPALRRGSGSGRHGARLAVALACLLWACGAPAIRPEAELFREASLAFEEESYNSAIEDYKVMLEQYPFSDRAEIASLNIAHAYFLTEEFSKAIDAFNDFERLHPVSPLLPFVGYTIGMCYLEQSNTSDRDNSASEAALRQFEKLQHQFPASLWAKLAKHRAEQAREILGGHELFVGDYYRARKQEDAAAGRYRFVMQKYPSTQAAQRAQQRLAAVPAAAAPAPQESAAAATATTAPAPQDSSSSVSAATAAHTDKLR